MVDYIKRDDVLDIVATMVTHRKSVADVYDVLEELPVADVVEQKHGKWIPVEEETGVEAFGFKEKAVVYFRCSICDKEVDVSEGNFKYCPNCGVRMDGEDADCC